MSVADSVPGLEWSEDGYSSLSGSLKAAADALDAIFLSWAVELGAREYLFPNFIAARNLAPIDYLESFPQLANFAATIARDDGALREIAGQYGKADALPLDPGRWEPAQQLLTPAACYHFYHRLADMELSEDRYLTTKCLCHRRENSYQVLRRQSCFLMREIVCIGGPDSVQSCVRICQTRIDELIERLGLEASWVDATDPFFDPREDPKALAQLVEPVKKELVLADGLALASVNRHRTFFSDCYNIRIRGERASSACAAVGIERWLYALIQAHGPDPAAWPLP